MFVSAVLFTCFGLRDLLGHRDLLGSREMANYLIVWKAAERSSRRRHDTFCDPIALTT